MVMNHDRSEKLGEIIESQRKELERLKTIILQKLGPEALDSKDDP
jgi:hypothetical protein